jgi:hypothetical protein
MKDLRAVNQPVEADQYNSFRQGGRQSRLHHAYFDHSGARGRESVGMSLSISKVGQGRRLRV